MSVIFFAAASLFQFKVLLRSPIQLVIAVVVPIARTAIVVAMFRAGTSDNSITLAVVGAGLVGVWSSVLFGSAGAIQNERWRGTLELLVLAPRSLASVLLPVTTASALLGLIGVFASLVFAGLFLDVQISLDQPLMFLLALTVFIFSLSFLGLLLATAFVWLPNANAFANTLEYPIWIISGLVLPLTALPAWLQLVGDTLPPTWGATAIRAAVDGGAVGVPVGVCAALGLAALFLGWLAVGRTELRARTDGTLGLRG
ncbi:ABC transporter permease [Paenarthrobacter nicotinovorans]|uniref:ABC transporter permease n=1 Tax=Paenarthrobacter nicotinovorans TaxID=29320 RepID=UPI003D668A93